MARSPEVNGRLLEVSCPTGSAYAAPAEVTFPRLPFNRV